MTHIHRAFFIVMFSTSTGAFAATVNYAGSVEDITVNNWRTAATAKPMDIDGNNIYGSHGAVHWTVVGANEFPAGSASPGWSYQGEVTFGQFSSPAYAQIDNLLNPATDSGAGIGAVGNPGSFTFEMTGVTATYAGNVVRVGVMADVLSSAEWAADFGKTFRVLQTVGGSGDSGTISLRGGGAGNGQPEMYFFDITGVNPGDRFQIIAGNGPGQPGYIGSVSWDVAPVIPEPSGVSLAGLAAGAFLHRRNRRR